ncbi:MAG: serine/threonine protein kinase [Burkholderiaceae bacterium]|nr:serine/threonine protein kinase [Burkholderiaceae bacterium]
MTLSSPDWAAVRALFDAVAELPPAEREARLADPALDAAVVAEVRSLLAHGGETSFLAEPAEPMVEPGREGQVLGAWRIVAPLGSGGMGQVWLAERADGAYSGEAAVKVLKRGMDTEAVLARFAQEQQALARLSHPHIARLLDAGRTADGLPYFVMERVHGRPIDQACDGLTLEARLALFLQLADAVAHAHRHLLVHRDLKPANVLVDADGQVKLLDFGIAKALQEDAAEATHTGQRAFTPHYASPEQVRGEPVSTATDLYSLGVLLYVMLTGQRPYGRTAGSAIEAARAVLEEEPTRPSSLSPGPQMAAGWVTTRRRLQGDLDNILLKTLEKPVERRYPSVEALSADVRAFIAGYPVSARPAGWGYRAGKFVRRNRAAVAAAGVAAVALLGGFGLVAWQGAEAARARDDAQARLAQTRAIARDIVARYADAVTFLPGGLQLKADLLRDTLGHLDRLSADGDLDPALAGEVAMAYSRLADMMAGDNDATLNDPDAASRYSLRALDLFPHGEAAYRDDPAFYMWWARAMRSRFFELRRQRDIAGALQWSQRIRDLLTPVVARLPDAPTLRHELGSAWIQIGQAHDTWMVASLNQPEEALAAFEQAEALYRSLLGRSEKEGDTLYQLGTIAGARMLTLNRLGRSEEAVAHGQRGLQYKQQALALEPGNVAYRQAVAGEANNLAVTMLDAGQPQAALPVVQLSEATMRALEADDPGNATWTQRRRFFALHYGRVRLALGQPARALPYLAETLQAMAGASAGAALQRRALAGVALAEALAATGRRADAAAALQRALTDLDASDASNPDARVLRAQVAALRADLAPAGAARQAALSEAQRAVAAAQGTTPLKPAQQAWLAAFTAR